MSENYGFRVSKPTKDVLTDTDANMHYSSKFNILKVQQDGTFDVSYNGTTHLGTQTEIVHGLNFTPTFLAFIEAQSGKWTGAGGDSNNVDDLDYLSMDAYADADSIFLTVSVSVFSTRRNTHLTLNAH